MFWPTDLQIQLAAWKLAWRKWQSANDDKFDCHCYYDNHYHHIIIDSRIFMLLFSILLLISWLNYYCHKYYSLFLLWMISNNHYSIYIYWLWLLYIAINILLYIMIALLKQSWQVVPTPHLSHAARHSGRRCFLQNWPKRDFSAAVCSCCSAKTCCGDLDGGDP